MQLVERDKLTLDAPLATVLPDLAETQVLDGFDSEGTPRLRPPRQPITLRNLLTHTAGFCYDMWNGDMVRYLETTGIPPFRSGLNAAMKVPIMRDPGPAGSTAPISTSSARSSRPLAANALTPISRTICWRRLG